MVTPDALLAGQGIIEPAYQTTEVNLMKKNMVNQQDGLGRTKLHLACQDDNVDVVRYLVEKGADSDIADGIGLTPFFMAIKYQNINVIKYLAGITKDINRKSVAEGFSALHLASSMNTEHQLTIIKLLIEKGADINIQDNKGFSPVYYPVMDNNIELLQYFIDIGANVNIRNGHGYRPIHLAADCGYVEIVKMLIAAGADIHANDNENNKSAIDMATGEVEEYFKKMGKTS